MSFVHIGSENAVEIKAEADSNDVVELSLNDKPSIGMFVLL